MQNNLDMGLYPKDGVLRWVCQALNFLNQTIINGDTANFVNRSQS